MSQSIDPTKPSAVTLHLAYAEASIMLIEGIVQLLIDRRVVRLEEVVETIETTIQTKRLLAEEGAHPEISRIAAGVLTTLANSVAAGSSHVAEGSSEADDSRSA